MAYPAVDSGAHLDALVPEAGPAYLRLYRAYKAGFSPRTALPGSARADVPGVQRLYRVCHLVRFDGARLRELYLVCVVAAYLVQVILRRADVGAERSEYLLERPVFASGCLLDKARKSSMNLPSVSPVSESLTTIPTFTGSFFTRSGTNLATTKLNIGIQPDRPNRALFSLAASTMFSIYPSESFKSSHSAGGCWPRRRIGGRVKRGSDTTQEASPLGELAA